MANDGVSLASQAVFTLFYRKRFMEKKGDFYQIVVLYFKSTFLGLPDELIGPYLSPLKSCLPNKFY